MSSKGLLDMTTGWDITSDDVVSWSERVDAPHRLPELIRRLLLGTAPLRSIEMRAHGGTRLGGWDGTIVSAGSHAICPGGVSAWELSVQADTRKLESDYAKRVALPGATPPSQATYVAVSGRRVDRKREWEDEKRKAGRWKDVRVIDADDIATWLATAPAVARWFGGLIGRPAFHLLALDEYLESWEQRTAPPLPLELLVAGRQRARSAASVVEWAERGDNRLAIEADTADDALMFAASALATSGTGDTWRSRTVVVESRDALRWAMRTTTVEPLIILPAYADFDAGHADAESRLIIPLDRKTRSNAILLGDVPFNVVSEVLKRSDFHAVDAARLAAESGGNLSALQRLCGYHGAPRWPARLDRSELAALLLLGAWTPGNDADADAIRRLGCDPDHFERLCEELSTGTHASTVKDHDAWQRSSWSWISEAAAWADLAPELPSASLRSFASLAVSVLSEPDPKFELDIEQRFAAAIHGKVLRHSAPLRAGVARAVARLAGADVALQSRHGPLAGSRLAESIVRRVLTPPWTTWASLGNLLPTLAEASPSAFIGCLEASLDTGASGVGRTFDEEGPFGGPHVPIVAALETLGWNPETLPRLALVTARLAKADVHAHTPGRVVNRPARTFATLFHPVLPATVASAIERFSALRQAIRAYPDIGFDAVLNLLSTANGGIVFPGHAPEIACWPRLSRDELWSRAAAERASNYAALVDIALEFVKDSPSRWSRLLLVANRLDDDLEERVVAALSAALPTLKDDDALVWSALRETLHRDTWYEGEPPRLASTRQQLYERCEPTDPVHRVGWLFKPGVSLPDGDPRDWELTGKRRTSEQQRALETLWQLPDALSLLHRLAVLLAKDGWTLGHAFARSYVRETAEAALLSCTGPQVFPLEVRASYIAVRVGMGGSSDWLETVLGELVSAGHVDDALEIALRLPSSQTIWDSLDAVDAELARMFWTRVERLFVQDLPTETISVAMNRLVACGNIATATEIAFAAKEKVGVPDALAVLEQLKGDELTRFVRRATGSYMLEELLKQLGAARADGAILAVLELRFLPLFQHGTYRPKHFSAAMASEPRHFVELVTALYRREGDDDSASDAEGQRHAEAAYHVLDAWKGYPGEGETDEAREETLYSWAKTALDGLADAGRLAMGTSELAKVLARVPGHSGHWPCLAARRLLEERAGLDLASRMSIAKRNLRGMTSRAVGEGGRQERLLEQQYRDSSAALRIEWPTTSALLEELAQDYAFDAARQDAGARAITR